MFGPWCSVLVFPTAVLSSVFCPTAVDGRGDGRVDGRADCRVGADDGRVGNSGGGVCFRHGGGGGGPLGGVGFHIDGLIWVFPKTSD